MAFQFREKALRKQAEIEDYCRELGLLDEGDDYLVKEEFGSHHNQQDDEMNEFVMNDAQSSGHADVEEHGQSDEFLEVDGSHEQQEVITDDIEYLEDNYTIEMNPEHEDVVLETKYENTVTQGDIKLRRGRTRFGMNIVKSEQRELQHQYGMEAGVVDIKPRRGRARAGLNSLRTSDGNEKGGYVCDVCGNFYEKRGRMMEHRRRHDSVCQYQCE